jgi:hypothetical protein
MNGMSDISNTGFRLCAQGLLPIDSTTLVYGSSDGGATVHASDEDFNVVWELVASRLKLKKHFVGDQYLLELHGPVGVCMSTWVVQAVSCLG